MTPMSVKPVLFYFLSALVLLSLAGCSIPPAASPVLAQSDKPRETTPSASSADLSALAEGNTAFALDLYQELKGESGNLFYSPYSISLALAMTYAGARGVTAQQMASALQFSLSQEKLHPAFNALALALASRAKDAPDDKSQGFQLNVANALWGQSGFQFEPSFLDLLAVNYGAGMRLVDFKQDPEKARLAINDWVAQQTEQRIKDLIARGSLDQLTRLVLTNAIYFKANWQNPFEKTATQDGDFHLLDGSTVSVPIMRLSEGLDYAQGEGYQAVSLPYVGGNVSMLVVVPDEGQFNQFQSEWNAAKLNEIVNALQPSQVSLSFPKFTYSSEFALKDALTGLGMVNAFDPGLADFSGMDGKRDLFVSDVIHKAFVAVDEDGTEAAAATAVIMKTTAMPVNVVELKVDRPFIFLIRDDPTGAVLFVGRVLNPSAS
jgi:serpin B